MTVIIYHAKTRPFPPFALSLSKGFDKRSPNGESPKDPP
jgi:hypothetical protein